MHSDVLDFAEVGAENFDAENRAETGGEHLGARLDRHPEDIRHAGRFDFLIHLRDELFPGHAGPPLVGWFELHHGFDHRERRGVGRGFGLPGLAEDTLDFGELPQHPILDLKHFHGFGDGDAGDSGGHEQDVALVQRRHELLAKTVKGDGVGKEDVQGRSHSCQQDDWNRQDDHWPAEAQHELYERLIDPYQEAVHRVPNLRGNLATDEPHHEHGHECHPKERSKKHRKRLGECQRAEQPAFLRFE